MINKDIIEVLEENFIEYASPILCNNLPSLDGLLPVHRKVIWGMNEQGITHKKPVIKMLRASGYVLPYYTFGDMPLANAMKNMGNNSLNYKYIFPKGNFGDKQRKNAKGASARYIECKLDEYSSNMLKGIEKKCVPMKRNYDNTKDEPIILPSQLPNILINTSQSIAVGEASKIPGHNLNEVCDCFIEYIKNKDIDRAIEILNGADYSIGGQIVYEPNVFKKIYKSGKGSFRIVGKYRYNKKDNSITIYEVPYETYIDTIESEIRDKVEKGILKEVLDTHNSTDKNGIGLIVYLRRNTNVDDFILKLRKNTSFEKTSSCNFTILDLDGKTPMLMTLEDIILKWREHRHNCIKAELTYDLNENNKQLNKLYGLKTISQDLDKAIHIIRNSKKEKDAISNLINEFGLNMEQSEYISTIRLVNINEEWIFNKLSNIKELESKNNSINKLLLDEKSIDDIIIFQLNEGKKKYGRDRLTTILKENTNELKQQTEELLIEDYNCVCYLTKEGYFKKVKAISNKGNNKLKDGDDVKTILECSNKDELLVFCEDLCCYKFKLHDIEETKLSNLGQYLFNETKSKVLGMSVLNNVNKNMLVVYKNGSVANISLSGFETKQNRKSLSKSLHNSDVVDIITLVDDIEIDLVVTDGRVKRVDTSELTLNKSRNSSGAKQYTWKNQEVVEVKIVEKDVDNVG